jgi:BirA family biotin operon repressor/biotin-[acetyl-CoA-carboxylase] ligase
MESPVPYLGAAQIRAATFVRTVEVHDTLDSTNVRAIELACEPTIELPFLVAARLQTAGKGRGSNQWWAADGALTFSLMIDSAAFGIGPQKWPQLSLATAVAVCDAITVEAPQAAPSIKWPNDVCIGDAKVCGILIESPAGSATAGKRLIIGVGTNVNNSWTDAPHDVARRGMSLCDFTGRRHDLQSVLVHALRAMERRYTQLAVADAALPQAWRALSCLTERRVAVQTDNQSITGRCKGINDQGHLLIENIDGLHYVRSGSVKQLEKDNSP